MVVSNYPEAHAEALLGTDPKPQPFSGLLRSGKVNLVQPIQPASFCISLLEEDKHWSLQMDMRINK